MKILNINVLNRFYLCILLAVACCKCFNLHPVSREITRHIRNKFIICQFCGLRIYIFIYILLEYHFICIGNICPYCSNKLYNSLNEIESNPDLIIPNDKNEKSDDELTLIDSDEEKNECDDEEDIVYVTEIEKPSESYLYDKYIIILTYFIVYMNYIGMIHFILVHIL